ncbi:MAG: T9SS type A sorting domain-containing protein [Bacteroidota bacterium]
MKNQIGIFLLSLILCLNVTLAQTTFENIYGTAGDETYNEVAFHPGANAYFAVGQMGDQASITRIDLDGDVVWTQIYGPHNSEFLSVAFNPNNQDIVVAGLEYARTGQNHDISYVRINGNGGLLSSMVYTIPNSQRVVRPKIMHSRGSQQDYLIAYANVPNTALNAYDNLGLMRISNIGTIQWGNEYFTNRTSNDDQFYDVIPNDNGGIWYTSYTANLNTLSFIGAIDGAGTLVNNDQRITPNGETVARMVSLTQQGNFLIAGGVNTAMNFSGNGLLFYMNVLTGQTAFVRVDQANTGIRSLAFSANNQLLAKTVNGNNMDMIIGDVTAANLSAQRYAGVADNASGKVNTVGNLGIITNRYQNHPDGFGALDNMVSVIDLVQGSSTCISEAINLSSTADRVNMTPVTLSQAVLLPTSRLQNISMAFTEQFAGLCCDCSQVQACFETCAIDNCIECGVVLRNCSESGCGFAGAQNPWSWEIINLSTNDITTSNNEHVILTSTPGTTTTFQVCLKVVDSEGCFSQVCDDVVIQCGLPNSLIEETIVPNTEALQQLVDSPPTSDRVVNASDMNESIQIHPNPAQEEIQIDFGKAEYQQVHLSIFNVDGQLVRQQKLGTVSGPASLNLDLPNGMYFLKILQGEQSLSEHKLLIQK